MEITKREFGLMSKVANRGLTVMHGLGYTGLQKLDLMMDLEYAHEDSPLDFEKILGFDDGDFAHDIFGIYRNFNRETKTVDNFFLPRCSVPENDPAPFQLMEKENGEQICTEVCAAPQRSDD